MKQTVVCLLMSFLLIAVSGQLTQKSILFTDPQLNVSRCRSVFNKILQSSGFSGLADEAATPVFLQALPFPASQTQLQNQLNIIKQTDIYVEVGPNYLYGPSFFERQNKTNMENTERISLELFDLNETLQNLMLEAAFNHLTEPLSVVHLAYIYTNLTSKLNPLNHEEALKFVKSRAGSFRLYMMEDFVDVETLMSQILVQGSNVIVVNVPQSEAISILQKAHEKTILHQPFKWLVFNAGLTLANEEFDVGYTNFFAVELSTNGPLEAYPELSDLPRPISTRDLLCRDAAIVGLEQLAKLLKVSVDPPKLLTLEVREATGSVTTYEQTWLFYSYITTTAGSKSNYQLKLLPDGRVEGNFQKLQDADTSDDLLALMQSQTIRIGTIPVPPRVIVEKDENGSEVAKGPEITLAIELFNRLKVPYEIIIFDDEIGHKVGDRWTGAFGRLQEWDADILVGPISETQDRNLDFRSSPPFRTFAYNFLYHRPDLKASKEIFQFVVAFDVWAWILILVCTVIVAGALALIHRISPNELSYSIHPSMLFVFGYLFHGVRTRPANRVSSQIVIIVWWLFSLVLVIAFCSNYAAYRSFKALEPLPTTATSLLHQDKYKYAYIQDSSLETLLNQSLWSSMYSLYQQINTKFKQYIPPTRETGIKQVVKGGFALLDESPFNDYNAKRYCLEESSPLWYGSYVFYMPMDFPYNLIINEELTKMDDDGTIERIFRQAEEDLYASLPKFCGDSIKDKALEAMREKLVDWSPYSILFSSAFGIFIIILCGLLAVAITVIVEICLGVYRKDTE